MGKRVGQIVKPPEVNQSNSNSRVQRIKRLQLMDTPVNRILYLQRTAGNQAVQRLVRSGALQAKLRIGQSGDMYEQEADRVADVVMRMPEPGVQQQVEPEEEEEIQPKSLAGTAPEITPEIGSDIQSIKGAGQSLSASERAFFEPRFGADFGNVRVHSDAQAVHVARSVNARAFTFGRDVVFGAGQYAPEITVGQKLLAHELTHVVQQGAGVRSISKPKKISVSGPKNWIHRKVKRFKPKKHWGGISYRRLLADKKLEIGVAIGYPFLDEYKKLTAYLKRMRFSRIGQRWKRTKRFRLKGKRKIDVDVIIDIINHKSKNPKKHFAEFLSSKEIAVYSGHARFGTSPDFDSKKSVKENFIIGVNSALHKTGKLTKGSKSKVNKALVGKANDLEAMSKAGRFDPKLYQIWFFNACTTIHYLDEIRGGLVKGKDRTNLRVVGTTGLIFIDALPFIDGILKQQSMSQILRRLNKAESAYHGKKTVRSRYFSD